MRIPEPVLSPASATDWPIEQEAFGFAIDTYYMRVSLLAPKITEPVRSDRRVSNCHGSGSVLFY